MTQPGPIRRLVLAMCLALHRAAERTAPVEHRRRVGPELNDLFRRELIRRRGEVGLGGTLTFALRASFDTARQGWRERTRIGLPPGHGRPERPRRREGGMMQGLGQDLRVAMRTLMRSPGFTAAAVAVLALGIGANTTVFSALREAILAPAPYPDAERLVLADLIVNREGSEPRTMVWSYPKFRVLAEAPDPKLDLFAGYASRSVTLTEVGPPTRISVELVSPGYFELLGMQPVLGRGFSRDEDDTADPPLVAVISHEMWRARFGDAPDVLGRDIVLNGNRVQVVGVAPRGFRGLTGGAEAWIPLAASGEVVSPFMPRAVQAHWMRVIGRLAPGVALSQAQSWMASIGDAVHTTYPGSDAADRFSAGVRSFESVRVNEAARSAVLLLAAAAGLVLLVACANLSGLLLARAKGRARDGAVRLAVGASRWRLVRGSLVESGVLAVAGGVAGLILAHWGTRAMAAAWPRQFSFSGDGEVQVVAADALQLDGWAFLFALLVAALTVVLFGLVPAVRSAGRDVAAVLKDGVRGSRRGVRLFGLDLRGALVAGQVGLALLLLIGAGLVGGSVRKLLDVDLGFTAEKLLTFQLSLGPDSGWRDDPLAFHQALEERLGAIPGVEGVALGMPPLSGHWSITLVEDIEGKDPIVQGEGPAIGVGVVNLDYFQTLGVPLIRGRFFDSSDGDDAEPTVIINRQAAETLFPGEDPIGRRIEVGVSAEGKERLSRIVGVVGDVRYDPPDRELMPEAYFALREFPLTSTSVSLRTAGDPQAALPDVRSVVAELDPALPLASVRTMEERVREATGDRRVILWLLSLFAAVTILLAATGTWGIVSYAVADRRRELGLRMALGARGGRVMGAVLRQSLIAAFLGVTLGLGGALIMGRLLEAFLWDTSPRDPWAFAAGTALLLGVVVVASILPARRATRLDPVEALRAE